MSTKELRVVAGEVAARIQLFWAHHDASPLFQRNLSLLKRARGRPYDQKAIAVWQALSGTLPDPNFYSPEAWDNFLETICLLAPIQAWLPVKEGDRKLEETGCNLGGILADALGNEPGGAVERRFFQLLRTERNHLEKPLTALLTMVRGSTQPELNWPGMYSDLLDWPSRGRPRQGPRVKWAAGFSSVGLEEDEEKTAKEN